MHCSGFTEDTLKQTVGTIFSVWSLVKVFLVSVISG